MSVVSYKCPRCGGGMKYQPGVGFKCEYCLSVSTQEELDAFYAAQDSKDEAASAEEQAATPSYGEVQPHTADSGEAALYTCPSCGAEVITEATTAATTCHYCHNPIVLSANLGGQFNPDIVIPFTISKEQAAEQFKKHCSDRFFLPKDFYSEQSIQNLYGVYYPYWIVDSRVSGSYRANGIKRTSTRVGNDRRVTTHIYKVERSGNIEMNNLTNAALKKADQTILKYIQPFKPEGFIDFSMSYLSGFRAEKRDVERFDLTPTVEKQKREYTKQLLSDTVKGYDTVSDEFLDLDTLDEEWKYALLPVWILVYSYAGQTFTYGINGQTGKSYGELPIDNKKLNLFTVIVGIVVAILAIFVTGLVGC